MPSSGLITIFEAMRLYPKSGILVCRVSAIRAGNGTPLPPSAGSSITCLPPGGLSVLN